MAARDAIDRLRPDRDTESSRGRSTGPARNARRAPALAVALALLLLSVACGSDRRGPAAPTNQPIRVLMLTATAGFRHDSIDAARQAVTALGAASGEFTVTALDDVSGVDAGALAGHDVLFFALTTGELPFTDAQKSAIVSFVQNGGGFIGAHSATDTLYQWPEYGALVGAYFKEHPWTQTASVIVETPSHPATAGLGSRFDIREEFYTFQENPRPRVQVLLRLDPDSVGATGDFPLAWAQSVGAGRSYYNALGHFSETWTDPRFQQQIAGAIRWTAGRE